MMNNERQKLIDQLSSNLAPVKATNLAQSVLIWTASAFVFTIVVTSVVDPFRENSLHQLMQSMQFLVESVLGAFAILLLIYTAFDLSIPSSKKRGKQLTVVSVCLVVWVGFYIVGLIHPALEPSMAGKRELCWLETVVYAIPLMVAALVWCKKQYPLYPVHSGVVLGFAAGAVPALLMQFACMYVPEHILTHHILPGLLIGVLGAVCGYFYLREK